MKFSINIIFILCALVLGGCVTNDFKVVDALHPGMTLEEAQTTITSFGFERDQVLVRPAAGWVADGTFTNLAARASVVEERSKKKIITAEYYPVGHGFLGAGELFLFYGEDGRLVEFYRHQIN